MYIGIQKLMLKCYLEQLLSCKKKTLTEIQEDENKLQQGHETSLLFLPQPANGSWINRAIFYSQFAII